jgi:hypothetical protein
MLCGFDSRRGTFTFTRKENIMSEEIFDSPQNGQNPEKEPPPRRRYLTHDQYFDLVQLLKTKADDLATMQVNDLQMAEHITKLVGFEVPVTSLRDAASKAKVTWQNPRKTNKQPREYSYEEKELWGAIATLTEAVDKLFHRLNYATTEDFAVLAADLGIHREH